MLLQWVQPDERALRRVEDHTRSCSVSNLPGGQGDCTTCQKWQGMIKLREHYRRKLIHYMKQTFAKHILKDQSAGSHERAAEAAAEAAARAVKGGPPPPPPTKPRGNDVQNVAFMLAGGGGVAISPRDSTIGCRPARLEATSSLSSIGR